MKKENSKALIVLDSIDLEIYDLIRTNPNITIGVIKEKLKITHASLTPHLKRLEALELIKRERENQTIHLDITKKSEKHSALFYKVLDRLRENKESLRIK